ncbi:MAG: class I SAM-dependent methyltransferase [Actinomycetota bacterium]|nr:class I SAM-dependent methyltransferase [Actinomycetota bacterium]
MNTGVDVLTAVTTAESYKAEQRQQWDTLAGQLRTWWPAFEGFMAPVTQAMLAHARLPAGARVLDVATGFGEPALTAARLVGPAGRVVASDLSPAMLAVAAQRARDAGLSNVAFAEMDAEQPTLPESGFDAVVCRLGLMFLPNLDAALARLAALLVPGGRLVAAVWGPQQANPWLTVALQTLTEFLELVPARSDAPGIFDLAAPGVVERALTHAALSKVRATPVGLRCAWPSVEAYTQFHQTSPMGRLVPDEQPAQQAQAWREVGAMAARRWGPGPLRLRGQVLVVSGRRPLSNGPVTQAQTQEMTA